MSLQVFGCPDCAQRFQVDSSQAGQQVRCPGCSAVVQIPEVLGDSSETAPSDRNKLPEPPPHQETPEAFACPACKSAFGVLPSMYGTSMACPHCGQGVAIDRAPPSTGPEKSVHNSAATEEDTLKPSTRTQKKKVPEKKRRSPKSKAESDAAAATLVAEGRADDRFNVNTPPKATNGPPTKEEAAVVFMDVPASELDPPTESLQSSEVLEEVAVFTPQSVDHLLPPRFATLDPAFFYRRGNSTDQVLLPQADGGVQAVSNRIVTIVHNGREHQLISSPRYRRNLNIIVNVVLMLIAAVLMVAIWWAVA